MLTRQSIIANRVINVILEFQNSKLGRLSNKVIVQGVKSLGCHFACLCWEFDFYEGKKCYLSKRKGKYFYTFNRFHSEKS